MTAPLDLDQIEACAAAALSEEDEDKAIEALRAMPTIIAEVKRLQAEVERLTEQLDDCCEVCLDKCTHVTHYVSDAKESP